MGFLFMEDVEKIRFDGITNFSDILGEARKPIYAYRDMHRFLALARGCHNMIML